MKFLLALLLCVPGAAWAGARIYKSVTFDRECQGYLKRAADANTPDIALKELARALSYIEANDLTSGYTSVLYTTPNEDIGFWYRNIKQAHDELAVLPPQSTPLEKSNMLMKLRETLLDSNDKSTDVTVPGGISVYPNNTAYAIWGWLGLFLLLPSGLVLFWAVDEL